VKSYNAIGYLIILLYLVACMYSAPTQRGPWIGLLIGAAYFVFCWFVAGLYLADVLHLGIAHRSLDYKEWFIKLVSAVNNVFGIYVDPIAWVNRHRLHHKNADHDGDPNKVASDGFWRTMVLCVLPYRCQENLATDSVLRSRSFRMMANPVLQLLPVVEAGRKPEVCGGDVVWDADLRTVGQYDSKLLDPHARFRIPALSR